MPNLLWDHYEGDSEEYDTDDFSEEFTEEEDDWGMYFEVNNTNKVSKKLWVFQHLALNLYNLQGDGDSAQRVGFFNIGSGRVGYWKKYRVAGRVRVG